MKIGIINFTYFPYEEGGCPVVIRTLIDSLKERGHDIFVITTKPFEGIKSLMPSFKIEGGIKVYRFYPLNVNIPMYTNKKSGLIFNMISFILNFWNPHSYLVIKNILKKEQPDLVHIHEVTYLSLSTYSASRCVPQVSTIHSVLLLFPLNNLPELDKLAGTKFPFNFYFYKILSAFYRKLNLFFIGNPNCVTFVSNAIKEKYIEYNFFKKSKKFVLKNLFKINKTNQIENLKKNKIFNILYAGGTIRKKGGHTLIKAFKEIKNDNICLNIFGKGDDDKYFKDLAQNDSRIIFHGQIKNNNLQKFYNNSNISVIPSECFESFGAIILESFRNGTPVICSNIGGMPEIVNEGYNGFLFNPGDIEELKIILEKLINKKNILNKMKINCLKTSKKYNVEDNIYLLENIYKNAIEIKNDKI